MARPRAGGGKSDEAAEVAFLLSQLGAHSAARFAERLEPSGLKPAHAGILRVVAQADGLSQQALGERLGVFPSRLVGLLDELEGRGLVERRDNLDDRRSYALCLTAAGREALERLGRVAREHGESLCAALDATERAQLKALLGRIVAEQGLTPGVHPGFRKLGGGPPTGC
jgi:DNA-binding MarR family transcriptional regulator